ncbi:MAG: hypothetical protein KDA87_01345 [Planctomycetales bacterium]|nr:hypothetical protein [Planctomycetales bacterium]
MKTNVNRRRFLQTGAIACAANSLPKLTFAQQTAETNRVPDVEVLHPFGRIPLSFVIDDSTCLVNMGHFCMPQFREAWPDRKIYHQPWQQWPREIPDAFVREFGEWCQMHGVKGKYSIVPYPACVGWLDRGLPGWSKAALDASLKLVRDLMVPNWDIHPEMITHTRVIDLKTGRPMPTASDATMENSFPQTDISVDELTAYMAFALKILNNCDLPCEGITTPGGFGNRVKQKLPQAVFEAVRDIYGTDLPHYFKYIAEGDEPTTPKLEYIDSKGQSDRLTMNVLAGTGDWFGGWEGVQLSEPDRYANADATSGRMVELIQRNQPAVMLCHWPGIYCNGTKTGFQAFQRIVLSLAERYHDSTIWMKLSEIGRYEAAKQLTQIVRQDNELMLNAPYDCPGFTIRCSNIRAAAIVTNQTEAPLRLVNKLSELTEGAMFVDKRDNSPNVESTLCFRLNHGENRIRFANV